MFNIKITLPTFFPKYTMFIVSVGESLDIHHISNATFDYLNQKSLDKVVMAL